MESSEVKLTEKQRAALQAAKATGVLFQLPESAKFAPATLASLCKAGLLERAPVGVMWKLTPAGLAALDT